MKEQFHSLRMDEHTKVFDHLSVLNGIFSELETIGVKIDDEDKSLTLIWSPSSSHEHIKPVLIHENENLSFEDVASKIISKERRLKVRIILHQTQCWLLEESIMWRKTIKRV